MLKAADNEAQLASVLAHEIGHIASPHLVNQMRQTAIARGIALLTLVVILHVLPREQTNHARVCTAT